VAQSQDEALALAFIAETESAIDQEYRRIVHCLEQLTQQEVWRRPAPGVNCIGTIILHLCGNLQQWFIHGVGGERDVRDRPAEFAETDPIPKEDLLERLRGLIERIHGVLSDVDGATLLKTRRIQGFETKVLSAIYSTVAHLEGHALQIAYIAHLIMGEHYDPFWKPENAEQGAE